MPRRPAPVVTGAIGPENRVATESESEPRAPKVPEIPDSYVFEAIGRGLRIQLTNGGSIEDKVTGIRTAIKPIQLQFRNGFARVDAADINILHRIFGCPESCGQHRDAIGKLAQPHGNFGLGRSFWLQKDREALATKTRTADVEKFLADNPDALKDYLSKNPETIRQVLEVVGSEFKLPAKVKAEIGKALDSDLPAAPDGEVAPSV